MRIIIIAVCVFFALTVSAQKKSVQNQPAVVADTAKPKGKGELIKPIKVWKDGNSVDADEIDCDIVYDDLKGSAKVYFQLKDSTGSSVASGNLGIDGADYRAYNNAPNKINWVYNFVIRALRLQNRQQNMN
jgi:hypothetical protein